MERRAAPCGPPVAEGYGLHRSGDRRLEKVPTLAGVRTLDENPAMSLTNELPRLTTLPPADPAIAFAVKLGTALHKYGMPAHLLEDTLQAVSSQLGFEGHFFVTPTGIFASFGTPEEQRTSMVRVQPGSVDLEKTVLLDELTRSVLSGETEPKDAAQQIDDIVARPSRYGPLVVVLCFGLASATSARFFGGGWREMAGAAVVGIGTGVLAILLERHGSTARVFEPVASMVAAAVAVLVGQVLEPASIYVMTVAGLIVLLPGLSLTIAMREIASQNLVAGTARLTGAGLVFFEMGFGVALGGLLLKLFPGTAPFATPIPLPLWTEVPAILFASLSLLVLFRARPRDYVLVCMAISVAFWGARFGSSMLGPELGVCIGAVLLGTFANALSRIANRPSAIWVVPGLMVLVPGSLGLGSVSQLVASDVVSGVETAFRMLLVAVGLVTGLLLSNVFVPPRREV